MIDTKSQQKAVYYAFVTIIFWSTVASAFKIGLRFQNSYSLLFTSTLTSFLIYLVFILNKKGIIRKFKELKLIDILFSMLMGFLNPFLYYLIIFKSYELLKAQIAQPLNFIWPIVLTLLSVPLLGQKFRWKNIIALMISFTGVIIITSQGNLQNYCVESPLGVILALCSSVIWSLYWIFNLKDKKEIAVKLVLNFFFASIYITLFGIITDKVSISSAVALASGIYVGLFEMGFAFILWLNALNIAKNKSGIANLIYITPFLSLIFIYFVLGEQIYYTSVIGLILIVFSILYQRKLG